MQTRNAEHTMCISVLRFWKCIAQPLKWNAVNQPFENKSGRRHTFGNIWWMARNFNRSSCENFFSSQNEKMSIKVWMEKKLKMNPHQNNARLLIVLENKATVFGFTIVICLFILSFSIRFRIFFFLLRLQQVYEKRFFQSVCFSY